MLAELVQKGGLNRNSEVSLMDQGAVADVATVAVAGSQSNHGPISEGWRDVIDPLPLLREDVRFVEKQMKQVASVPQRIHVAEQYQSHWKQAEERQPIGYRKENSGRFAANSYLRKEIDNVDTIH